MFGHYDQARPRTRLFHSCPDVQSDSPIACAVREYNRLLALGDRANRQEVNRAADAMNAMGGWELEAKAKDVLAAVGIADPRMPVGKMSGGQRRKVTVAAALLGAPDVLILDGMLLFVVWLPCPVASFLPKTIQEGSHAEPTNHMDQAFITWMTDTINDNAGVTIMLVTHDRAFMEATCTKILELDGGRGYVHDIGGEGSYERFRERRAERRAAQASAAQDARVVLRKETEWVRRQPKARQAKSRARVDAYGELLAKAQSGPKEDFKVGFGDIQMARQGRKVVVMQVCCVQSVAAAPHDPPV